MGIVRKVLRSQIFHSLKAMPAAKRLQYQKARDILGKLASMIKKREGIFGKRESHAIERDTITVLDIMTKQMIKHRYAIRMLPDNKGLLFVCHSEQKPQDNYSAVVRLMPDRKGTDKPFVVIQRAYAADGSCVQSYKHAVRFEPEESDEKCLDVIKGRELCDLTKHPHYLDAPKNPVAELALEFLEMAKASNP